MDTDDISVPDRFEKQIKILSGDPELVILGGQIIEFIEDISSPSGMRNVPLTNLELRQYAKKTKSF